MSITQKNGKLTKAKVNNLTRQYNCGIVVLWAIPSPASPPKSDHWRSPMSRPGNRVCDKPATNIQEAEMT
jgi:hypothetical protein